MILCGFGSLALAKETWIKYWIGKNQKVGGPYYGFVSTLVQTAWDLRESWPERGSLRLFRHPAPYRRVGGLVPAGVDDKIAVPGRNSYRSTMGSSASK